MMEVTPHLKSVLKNYQHSATKSLQGPGLSLVTAKVELPSPEIKEEEFVPTPFPVVQQLPILTTPDTSCSERSETILEGESISCFVVGGEKRLCLPQVLNSVLRDFSLQQINQECDQLQIYCSRCTPEQLNVLKNHAILPSGAPSCGLITKTDAERLCSALLHCQINTTLRVRKGALSFSIFHECFGKARGLCFPELYVNKNSKCIECLDCQSGFSPQQFVCHVHRHLENRTVHWGFDSCNWRCYLHVSKDQMDHEQYGKYLDEMRDQFEGKIPFRPPIVEAAIKRKQILTSDLIKEHELPLKKQKLDEYLNNLAHVPYNMQHIQQIYATIDPLYIHQYLQDFTSVTNRHLSAFKPVTQSIKESKIRHATAMGLTRYTTDPPLLQNPERVVLMSESEQFERTYQPNVALAPPTPKKHRYGKSSEPIKEVKMEAASPPLSVKESSLDCDNLVSRMETVEETNTSSPEKAVVSVVKSTPVIPKYNPEIELSTDTEDSASETSERTHSEFAKLEETLKTVESSVRHKVIELFKNLSKDHEKVLLDCRNKDNKISDLELRNSELTQEINELKKSASSTIVVTEVEEATQDSCSNHSINNNNNNNNNKSNNINKDTSGSNNNNNKLNSILNHHHHHEDCNGVGTNHNHLNNNVQDVIDTTSTTLSSSLLIKSTTDCSSLVVVDQNNVEQKSVIASLDKNMEQKAIIKTAPE